MSIITKRQIEALILCMLNTQLRLRLQASGYAWVNLAGIVAGKGVGWPFRRSCAELMMQN